MITIQVVNYTPTLDCSQDAGETGTETACDEIVMGAGWALCEFSLPVSQQNHTELSLTALDEALKRLYKKKSDFRELKMLKSAKTKPDQLLDRESHQVQEQNIHKIRATMEIQLYGAENGTASKRSQFQVHVNRARQLATIWLDADWQWAIKRLERIFHQVTLNKPSCSTRYSNIMSNNRCRMLGLRQPVPEALMQKKKAQMRTATEKRLMGQ